MGGVSFGTTADGQPGYKKAGADTVYPFSSKPIFITTCTQYGELKTNIASKVKDYKNKTADDFFFKNIVTFTHAAGGDATVTTKITYDSNTGDVTITPTSYGNYYGLKSFDLYVC